MASGNVASSQASRTRFLCFPGSAVNSLCMFSKFPFSCNSSGHRVLIFGSNAACSSLLHPYQVMLIPSLSITTLSCDSNNYFTIKRNNFYKMSFFILELKLCVLAIACNKVLVRNRQQPSSPVSGLVICPKWQQRKKNPHSFGNEYRDNFF